MDDVVKAKPKGKSKTKQRHYLGFFCDAELLAKIDAEARRQDRKRSDLVRMTMRQALN